jgi:enoyl-CoA hydratase/carnithine racemase
MTRNAATAGVRTRVDGAVATLTLSNPARMNALTVQMWSDLATLVAELDDRADVRVIVIRGADGNFSSGLDLSYLIEGDLNARSTIDPAGVTSPAEFAITSASTPVIAVIEGYCLGGGALVAIATDIRIASSTARFSLPPAKLGVVYPASSIKHLVALIGPSRAKLLLLTAEIIDAPTASAIGLVDRIVPGDDLDQGLRTVVQAISGGSALTQSSTKRLVEACVDRPDELESERDRWHSLALSSGELAEGIASFIEKREPAFPWSNSPRIQ